MKVETVSTVSERERKRTSAVDLLAWHEEKVLTQLVRDVYKAGMVGETWPTIGRIPMWWQGGALIPCSVENATEWRIVASVEAVPR